MPKDFRGKVLALPQLPGYLTYSRKQPIAAETVADIVALMG